MNPSSARHLNLVDKVIHELDTALRSIVAPSQRVSARPCPGEGLPENKLTPEEKRHVAGLMRVNHAGEVCAQALYQGQAATAKLGDVRMQMVKAAEEEIEHLAWCEQRLRELESHPSRLNLLWYMGSFVLGAMAGLAGDRWSLGFVAETERQVTAHLQHHLHKLPSKDQRSHAILSQMQADEIKHAETAVAAGGKPLPYLIRQSMRLVSKGLTLSSYYV